MSSIEFLMILSAMLFVFSTKMKMWETSLNSYVVILLAAIVSVSYQTPQLNIIFENRIWLFSLVLIFIFCRTAYQSIIKKYQELYIEPKKVSEMRHMLETIGDTIPDMLWLKDLDGKYLYANKAIKEKLLFQEDPIGKTDVFCALKAKEKYGKENHTFGEICSNSDQIIIENKKPQRFLENGNILGKMMYLEVYKAPLFDDDNNLIGVCGVGRDMTDYVLAFRESGCHSCDSMNDIFTRYEFK